MRCCSIPPYDNQTGKIPSLDPESALMFCYFNHMQYFHEYLDAYTGNCIILIGPTDGNRHCDPEPRLERAIKEFQVFKANLFVRLYNKFETAPNFIQLRQNLTSECLLISVFSPVFA